MAVKSSHGPIASGNVWRKASVVCESCAAAPPTVMLGRSRPATRTTFAWSRLKGSGCSGR